MFLFSTETLPTQRVPPVSVHQLLVQLALVVLAASPGGAAELPMGPLDESLLADQRSTVASQAWIEWLAQHDATAAEVAEWGARAQAPSAALIAAAQYVIADLEQDVGLAQHCQPLARRLLAMLAELPEDAAIDGPVAGRTVPEPEQDLVVTPTAALALAGTMLSRCHEAEAAQIDRFRRLVAAGPWWSGRQIDDLRRAVEQSQQPHLGRALILGLVQGHPEHLPDKDVSRLLRVVGLDATLTQAVVAQLHGQLDADTGPLSADIWPWLVALDQVQSTAPTVAIAPWSGVPQDRDRTVVAIHLQLYGADPGAVLQEHVVELLDRLGPGPAVRADGMRPLQPAQAAVPWLALALLPEVQASAEWIDGVRQSLEEGATANDHARRLIDLCRASIAWRAANDGEVLLRHWAAGDRPLDSFPHRYRSVYGKLLFGELGRRWQLDLGQSVEELGVQLARSGRMPEGVGNLLAQDHLLAWYPHDAATASVRAAGLTAERAGLVVELYRAGVDPAFVRKIPGLDAWFEQIAGPLLQRQRSAADRIMALAALAWLEGVVLQRPEAAEERLSPLIGLALSIPAQMPSLLPAPVVVLADMQPDAVLLDRWLEHLGTVDDTVAPFAAWLLQVLRGRVAGVFPSDSYQRLLASKAAVDLAQAMFLHADRLVAHRSALRDVGLARGCLFGDRGAETFKPSGRLRMSESPIGLLLAALDRIEVEARFAEPVDGQ